MSLLLIGAAVCGGAFLAWVIGANSASSAFGPVLSSGAISIFRASLVVGIFALLGAVLQGGRVTETIGDGMFTGVSFDPALASIILLTASGLIMISIAYQYPMPTAFTLVGSVIGTGLAAGGTPNIGQLQTIAFFWLIIPVIAALIGFLTATILRRFVESNERNESIIQYLLLGLGSYTAFVAGSNQSGLVVGPLVSAVDVQPFVLLLFGGLGMLIGAWTGSPRIIEAVSRDYSQMGPRKAVAALLSASVLAQAATLYGVPVSFNEAIIAAIVGTGIAGDGGVGREKILKTILAWIGALLLAATVCYGITSLVLML